MTAARFVRGQAFRLPSDGGVRIVRVVSQTRTEPKLLRCDVLVLRPDGSELGVQRTPMYLAPTHLRGCERVPQYDRVPQ